MFFFFFCLITLSPELVHVYSLCLTRAANYLLATAYVSQCTICSFILACANFISFFVTSSLMKWRPTLNCVWSLIHWIFSNVKRWSSNNVDRSILLKANSYNNIFNHNSSQHSWAIAQYSAVEFDRMKIGCFFILQRYQISIDKYAIPCNWPPIRLGFSPSTSIYVIRNVYVHNMCATYTVLMLPFLCNIYCNKVSSLSCINELTCHTNNI